MLIERCIIGSKIKVNLSMQVLVLANVLEIILYNLEIIFLKVSTLFSFVMSSEI